MTTTHNYHPTIPTQKDGHILRWITNDYWIDSANLLRGPQVRHVLIPEAHTQPTIIPDLAILHSNAGPSPTRWDRLVAYWRRIDITGEAHFQVATDGTLAQVMPMNVRADCNYKANRFWRDGAWRGALSFETEDNGAATLPVTPWSPAQLMSMVRALTCAAVVYGTWCTAPAAWNDRGIGHHVLFPEWSKYVGKTCPGAARIRQMDWIRNEVANRLAQYSAHTGWQCGKGFQT